MSNELAVSIVGVFALMISMATALLGYFKVYKQTDGNGRATTLQEWLNDLQKRCQDLEMKLRDAEARILDCEKDRSQLRTMINDMKRNSKTL